MILVLILVGLAIAVALLFGQMIVTEVLRGLDDFISLWHKRRKEGNNSEQDVRASDRRRPDCDGVLDLLADEQSGGIPEVTEHSGDDQGSGTVRLPNRPGREVYGTWGRNG